MDSLNRPFRWYNEKGERWCSGCQAFLPGNPTELFSANKGSGSTDNLHPYCKECQGYCNRRYSVHHPEVSRESSRRYRALHPERARETNRITARVAHITRRLKAEGTYDTDEG